jgi:GH25 family lysozyme M1 (1,4-beta-N-acetylmuramidase)/pterin-4a-carbinolamine dehydratase
MKKKYSYVFLIISLLFFSLLLFPEKTSSASTTVYGGIDYSPVYNYQYYIAHNPDVAKAFHGDVAKTLQHFVQHGMSEGRRASASFDVHSYYLRYPDLRRWYGKNWKLYFLHYMNHGIKEKRIATGTTKLVGAITVLNGVDYSAVYDYQYYLDHNPDLAKYYKNDDVALLTHFVDHGMSEGRRASASFDVHSYYLRYPDLRRWYGKNWKLYFLHYMNHGKKEKRVATGTTKLVGTITILNGVDYSAVYDYQYYLDHNPDLVKYYKDDDVALLTHFVDHGMSEGRRASASFDVHSYYLRYPDLRRWYGKNWKLYFLHYINHGQKEKRVATGTTKMVGAITVLNGVDYSAVYDYQYYLDHNRDLAKYYKNDDVALLTHFVDHGMSEGRRASASFDVHSYYLRYPDLRRWYGKNWKLYFLHYMNHGKKEKRIATGTTKMVGAITTLNGVNYSSVYDYQYYLDHNPDLAKYYKDDDVAMLTHFVNHGMSEGRQASSEFNVTVYRSNYPDLQKWYGDNYVQYYLHYIFHGKKEGREGATPTHNCNGWCVINGKKYYYQNGLYCTGLKIINGKAYYFSSSGVLSSRFGIDVSSYQGQIDWAKVKNDGVEFAMIRIGWGSDESDQDDAYAMRNISECKRLGIPYGVYLFSYAMNETEAASEARHILRLLNGDHPPLGVYLDVENNTWWPKVIKDNSGKITKPAFDPCANKAQVNKDIKIVMDTLKSKGYSGQTGIYSNPNFIRNVLDSNLFTNNKLWLANYRDTLPDYSFAMWQYSNGAGLPQISGISGNVDRDIIIDK